MKSILIVEDEDIIAQNLAINLKNLGYNTYIAESGGKALKIIEEKHPDLVLVDIVLPGKINGIELAHIIKDRINIPVIFVTAYTDEDTLQKAKITEPYGYITKPFDETDLKIALDIALYKFKMEQKLQESEKKLNTIFEFAPDGIYLNDLKGNFIDGNKSAEKIIGYKRKELIGKNFIELKILPSEYKQKAQENLIHNAKGESTGPDEFILVRKDGSKVPVEITTHPVEINNNIIVIGIARDISERKQAEDELRKEKRFTENIIATVPDSLLVIDKNLKIKSANRTFYETFQMKPEKVIGASIINILGNENKRLITELTRLFGTEEMLENFELHYRSKKMGSTREERRLTSKGERIFNITARGIIIAEEEEEEEEELVVLHDITERKQATEKVRESEEKYRSLTETVSDGIFTIDLKGKFTFLNSAFEKITGFQTKDYLGHRFKDILVPEYIDSTSNRFKRGIAGEETPLYEIEILHKEKGTILVELNVTSLYDKNRNIKGRIGSLRDITERKISEEKLKNAYTELENTHQELIQSQTLAALGEFSSGIAHEIRNPLANISALAQFSIKNYIIDKPIKKNLRAIIRSSEKANKIIKELLDFARPRKLVLKPGYIIDSINRACELTKAKRSNNQIRLYKRCSRRLPKIMIDEQRIQQVFLNIR